MVKQRRILKRERKEAARSEKAAEGALTDDALPEEIGTPDTVSEDTGP